MSECNRIDCTNTAIWMIGFKVWAEGGLGSPAEAVTGIRVCDTCRPIVRLDELLPDATWHQIRAGFGEIGYAPPDRASAQLTFSPLN